MKRICSLLLAVLSICFVGCRKTFDGIASSFLNLPAIGTASHEVTEHAHTALAFDALSDDVSGIGLAIARTRELLYRIENGEIAGANAQRALEEHIDAYRRYRTAASIAYVRYCFDVTDTGRKAAYETVSASLEELGCLLIDTELALSRDASLAEVYDAQTVARLQQEDALHDLSVLPLADRERELIGTYDALESLTVAYAGREWTKEEILSDTSLTFETFSSLYRMYRSTYNENAGSVFLELIRVRNEMARTLGFDSYAEYGYASYMRDYTPAEAQTLSDTVKRELVPLFIELQDDFYQAVMRLSCGTFSQEPTFALVETVIRNLLPELERPWTYMREKGMYDCSASSNRMSGSFTTYFETYGAPFLFTAWDDSYEMPTTMLHEFGHYAGYFLNGIQRMQSADPLDLAEIDSQGLELLAFSQYDILYGALADAARIANLTIALYAVITGCMEDEFQQFAYHTDNVTLEALNAEYERLSKAYGLYEMGLDGESWTEISHTFRAPMYYISYSTSMLSALQLLVLSQDNPDGAIAAYRSILMRPIDATFRDTIQNAGLSDPFDTDTVSALGQLILARYGE